MENFGEMFEDAHKKDANHIIRGIVAKEVSQGNTDIQAVAELCERTIDFINELAAEEIRYLDNKRKTVQITNELKRGYVRNQEWAHTKVQALYAKIIFKILTEKLG